MHRHTTWGRWSVALVQRTSTPGRGDWAVELKPFTAALPVGSGHWNSCNALPRPSYEVLVRNSSAEQRGPTGRAMCTLRERGLSGRLSPRFTVVNFTRI